MASVEHRALVFAAGLLVAAPPAAGAPTQDVGAQDADSPKGWTRFQRAAMGTTFSVRLRVRTPGDRAAAEAALDEVERLDRMLSTWRADSFVSHLNRTGHARPARLDVEMSGRLAQVLRLHEDTGGAFDVTVGPLVRAWGFHGGEGRVPGDAELERLRAAVGSDHLRLDAAASTLGFARPGVELDFGAIGKGWAVDAAVEILRAEGIESALVEGGTSTVFALGSPPGSAEGWRVSIRHPRRAGEHLAGVVLRDAALSVSGDTERFFVSDGVRYGHVLDPRTGRPVEGVAMAAAITGSAGLSDALSTAFFVLKEAGTRDWLRGRPEVRALLCLEDGCGGVRAVPLGVPDVSLTGEGNEQSRSP